jgi:hypothetical protein
MRRALSLMAVLLVAATAAMPQLDDKFGRRSLRGLAGVEVLVEDLTPEAEADGLWKTAIQTDVELKLRQAGIKVLTQKQSLAAPGQPCLHILVTTLKDQGQYIHGVSVELKQAVGLERDPSIAVFMATTWRGRGVLGTVGREKLQQVRSEVKDQVDQFINAYLSVNPK